MGTGPGDLLASDADMLPARLRSLRAELSQAAPAPSTSRHRHPPYPPYPTPSYGRVPQQPPGFAARHTVLAPERITAAAKGVQELDDAYRRFRTLENEILGVHGAAASGTGAQTSEQVLEDVRKQVAAAVVGLCTS
jgi:hypothetical protein